jgi:hypothetical protein
MTKLDMALVEYDGNGGYPYPDIVWRALYELRKQVNNGAKFPELEE